MTLNYNNCVRKGFKLKTEFEVFLGKKINVKLETFQTHQSTYLIIRVRDKHMHQLKRPLSNLSTYKLFKFQFISVNLFYKCAHSAVTFYKVEYGLKREILIDADSGPL